MPIYEYICRDCEKRFEALVMGSQKAQCPACHSKRLEQQLSVFAAHSGSAKGSVASGPCGSCGDPRGPGACSLKDLD